MDAHPFPLLTQFAPSIDVRIFTKADRITESAMIQAAMSASALAKPSLGHGNQVAIVRTASIDEHRADAIATDRPGLALAITWADCQNFVIFAPKQRITGLLHAGWRGLVRGIIPAFFQALKREWGIGGADVYVGAGPSLCLRCANFTDPQNEVLSLAAFIHGKRVDLRSAAFEQFRQAGVRADRFERSTACTRCSPQAYWTYRGGDRTEVQKGKANVLACVMRED